MSTPKRVGGQKRKSGVLDPIDISGADVDSDTERRRGGTFSSLFNKGRFKRKGSRAVPFEDDVLRGPAGWKGGAELVLPDDVLRAVLQRSPALVMELCTRECSNFAMEVPILEMANTPLMAEAMLSICEHKSPLRSCELIGAGIVKEIQESGNNKNTLFRGRTIANTLMGQYRLLIAVDYIRGILRPVFEHLQDADGSFELDPIRAAEEEEGGEVTLSRLRTDHQPRLERLLDCVRDSILSSRDRFPLQLRILCARLYEEVGHKFPEAKMLGVVNFIFLRFICVAIAKPITFVQESLYPDEEALSSAQKKRNERGLMLVSKVIQQMMNDVSESAASEAIKEEWLAPLDEWSAAAKPLFMELLEHWIQPVELEEMERQRTRSISGRAADQGIENPYATVHNVKPLEECYHTLIKRIRKLEEADAERAGLVREVADIDDNVHRSTLEIPLREVTEVLLGSIEGRSKRRGPGESSTASSGGSPVAATPYGTPPPLGAPAPSGSTAISRKIVDVALFIGLFTHVSELPVAFTKCVWKEQPSLKQSLAVAVVTLLEFNSYHPLPTPLTRNDNESCLTTADVICAASGAEPVVGDSFTASMIEFYAHHTASNFIRSMLENSIPKIVLKTNCFDVDAKKVPNSVTRASNARKLAQRTKELLEMVLENLNACPKALWEIFHHMATEKQYIIAPVFASALLEPVLRDPTRYEIQYSKSQQSQRLLRQVSAVVDKVCNGTMFYSADQAIKPLNSFIETQIQDFVGQLQEWAVQSAPTAVAQSSPFDSLPYETASAQSILEYVLDNKKAMVDHIEGSEAFQVEYRVADVLRMVWDDPYRDIKRETSAEGE